MSIYAQQLTSTDAKVRIEALQTLATQEELEEVVQVLPQLAACLADDFWKVRHETAEIFTLLCAKAAPQAATIGKLLTHANPGVVAAAAYALAAIGEGAASEASGLVEALDKGGEDNSTLALAKAGVVCKGAAALRKPTCAAAMALSALGSAGLVALPKLVKLLTSKDEEVRVHAATAIGGMGKEGAQHEGDLKSMMTRDRSPQAQAAAIAALGHLAVSAGASQDIAQHVAEKLKSKHPAVRAAAAKSIGEMGEEASAYLPQLVKLFNDDSSIVICNAIHALTCAGEAGQMFAGAVGRQAFSWKRDVRVAAIFAMPGFGKRGLAFRDEISRLLEDEDPDVASAALEVVQTMENAKSALSGTDDSSTLPIALLFPGQGSQYTKMLAEVVEMPVVAEMLAKAHEILGWSLQEMCLTGADESLEQTNICQPVMYVANLAAVELLKRDRPNLVEQIRAVAGLSLGEYSALCIAGVWDFEMGLKLVKVRAEAMQEASNACPQAMASVAGLDQDVLEAICKECAGTDGTCQIANLLFPKGFSVSGTKPEVEALVIKAKDAGALQAKMLKISGAFHTALMEPARERLLEKLRELEPEMKPTTIAIYVNVTGEMLPAGTEPSTIIPLLADQLCNPVKWSNSCHSMVEDGITEFFECGPMKQLKAMMKRISMPAWNNTTNVHV